MSMDPDGTNRIIQQQIKEWHAFVEGERNAKLAEPDASGARFSLMFRAANALRGLIGNLALHRPHLPQKPGPVARLGAERPADLVERPTPW